MNTRTFNLALIVLLCAAFPHLINAQQNIPDQIILNGIIAGGGFRWDENVVEGQPDYIFNTQNQVYIINAASQLPIEDGTIVHLAPGVVLQVAGLMVTVDVAENGIGFSQTVICGTNEGNPFQQPWGAIEIWGNDDPDARDLNGRVDLTNCLISGGGAGNDWAAGVSDWGGLIRLVSPLGWQDGVPDLRLTNCSLQRSQQHGIVVSSENDIFVAIQTTLMTL